MALGKWYFAEVPSDTRVWLSTPPVEPPGPSLLGRPRVRLRVKLDAPRSQEVRALAAQLSNSKWQRLTIQEGSQGPVVAEFAFLRVTTVCNRMPGPRLWLVVRRSLDAPSELKYYLCNAPATYTPQRLAKRSGQRWPIETVLEEAKGEVGMDHYETRTWRGWHHHMAQTFLAHHFLVQVRLQLKKIAGFDHGASATVGREPHRRREMLARYSGRD